MDYRINHRLRRSGRLLFWRFAALVIDLEQKRAATFAHPDGLGLLPQRFAGNELVCRVWQTGA